jgi:hypothetical protein
LYEIKNKKSNYVVKEKFALCGWYVSDLKKNNELERVLFLRHEEHQRGTVDRLTHSFIIDSLAILILATDVITENLHDVIKYVIHIHRFNSNDIIR